MPLLGLGVFRIDKIDPIIHALKTGYRHIDTASGYGNEEIVGQAVRRSKMPRDELFITTKLGQNEMSDPRKALEESLKRLGLDHVDLYLIHFPVKETRMQAWKELEELYHEGMCRSIGISTYEIAHIQELLSFCKVIPAVHQFEINPFWNREHLREFCRSHGIQNEGYCPLTRGKKFDNSTIVELSNKYKKTPAQIMIRWALQHNLVAIPKSQDPKRIEENADVFDFELTFDDMVALDSLDEGFKSTSAGWDSRNLR